MEENDINNILREQFVDLPESLKRAALDLQLKAKIAKISERVSVVEETQKDLIRLQTMFVIIALHPIKDFLRNLQKSVGLPEEKTRQIGSEISETIFKPIINDLKMVNEEIESARSVGATEQEQKPTVVPIRTTQAPPVQPTIPTPAINTTPPAPKYGIAPEMLGKKDDMEITPTDPSTSLVTDKLTSIVKLPKEQKFVSSFENKPKPGYDKGDPYREPLE